MRSGTSTSTSPSGTGKLACILEGVFTRYTGGSGGGDQTGFDAYATQVGLLAEVAEATLG